ncbi:MAG TPA: LptF/LptG family permease [Chthoniobacterales bacterium]
MTILDRYVLKKFFVPFFYCIVGFIAIWLVFDLMDNIGDFIEGHASLKFIVTFYLAQLPEVIVLILPIAMLLGLLYSLTQMSRSNEIISMLTAGRSVVRVLVPMFAIGFLLVGLLAYFNYEGAPHAEKTKKAMMKELTSGRKADERAIPAHMFRNRYDNRTWYMRKIYPALQKINDLQIIQQDRNGLILREWYARGAEYDTATKTWTLDDMKVVDLDPSGNVIKTVYKPEYTISDWSESPWRIASSTMNPDYLSVPELHDYLRYNADFPANRLAPYRTQLENRWAAPWTVLIVVFIAAPLGIVFSRRGIMGGVAMAIGLFFALFALSSLFVAFGKGSKLSPEVAAWSPYALFFVIGFILLWMRSTNRDIRIPKIFG